MNQALPSYVVTAKAHRDLYYSEARFRNARDLVVECGFAEAPQAQDDQLAVFLADRDIQHDATLEQLVRKSEPKVVLLGASFYFSRKFFTTSHDCRVDIENPVPLIQIVFNALAASDDKHAATFLGELSALSSGVSSNQRKIVAATSVILPKVTDAYVSSLGELESKHKVGSTLYINAKEQLDRNQRSLLDKVIGNLKHVIATYQEPSLKEFNKYSGFNGQRQEMELHEISIEYIRELAGRHGKNYAAAIRELEEAAGTLVIVTNHRERNADEIKLNVGTGSLENPQTNQFIYRKAGSNGIYEMLLAICDHISRNPLLPPESRTTTSISRQRIVSYQTKG